MAKPEPSVDKSNERKRVKDRRELRMGKAELKKLADDIKKQQAKDLKAFERLLYLLSDRDLDSKDRVNRNAKSSRSKLVDPDKWPVEDRVKRTRMRKRGRRIAA